jgi:hypothetical protein
MGVRVVQRIDLILQVTGWSGYGSGREHPCPAALRLKMSKLISGLVKTAEPLLNEPPVCRISHLIGELTCGLHG